MPAAKAPIAAPLGSLVSNINAGPLTPRDSMLISAADLARQRIAIDKGAGAVEPEFLAFVEQQDDGVRRRRAPAGLAATSSRVATPIPSSDAPGPVGVLS